MQIKDLKSSKKSFLFKLKKKIFWVLCCVGHSIHDIISSHTASISATSSFIASSLMIINYGGSWFLVTSLADNETETRKLAKTSGCSIQPCFLAKTEENNFRISLLIKKAKKYIVRYGSSTVVKTPFKVQSFEISLISL